MSKAAELANLIGNINAGGGGVNRNIVINGAMAIAQRGTQTNQTSAYTACDRWNFAENGSVVVTTSQDTDVPSGQGFANSLKIDVTTASGTLSSGNYALVRTKFEGQNLQHLLYGTSSAKPLTLSFWVKSPKTGTHVVQLTHSDAGYYNSITYTINSADTWEHKSVTFVGYQTTAFDNDRENSLQVYWWLMRYDEGTLTENTWHNTSANQASGQVNTMDNTSNNFYLTGVQLELGQNATEFEHRPIDEEFHRCLRYFEKLQNTDSSTTQELGTGSSNLGGGIWYGSDQVIGGFDYKVTKRATPTIACDDDQGIKCYTGNASRTVNDSNMLDIIRVSDCRLNLGNFNISGTQGYGTWVLIDSDHFITIDAEL